ncbi:hypothetical protein DH2020_045507 [Rehmannia glutinosa]|uniref:Uncharacterized protein n=1 Tax=Rehmannia glutinosa TaxID=99300 RepID=A0ABR0UEQ0_REHGL
MRRLGNVASVRFLTVAWTTNIKWNLVAQQWSKLPHLIGLDVSEQIFPNNVSGLFSSSFSLKVLCALNCPALEEDATFVSNNNREVIQDDGIRLLLNLAQSWQEGLQSEAAKAIASLSLNAKAAKAVVELGGIRTLANLARSVNRLVAEEAAGALWNLSFREELKCAIDEAFGVKALVDLIYQWSRSTGADDKCSIEFASMGGVHALVMLTRSCEVGRVQEQAARALTNLAAHWDTNGHDSAVGQEAGALDALVQLTRSRHDGVRKEAAGALWNLSYDHRNREEMRLVELRHCSSLCRASKMGTVLYDIMFPNSPGKRILELDVALANSCSNASLGLQLRAAGSLWGLSESEAYSIAIDRGGGVAPLIALAQSNAEDVHEVAAGALWNLAFYPSNALHIMEEDGIHALAHLCSSSVSKMARFMSALTLAYMFDGRIDDIALNGTPTDGTSKSVGLDGPRRMAMKHIEDFVMTISDPRLLSAAATSSDPASLVQVTEYARIEEAGQLRCSGDELESFIALLQYPSPALKSCGAFALLQFTIPGGKYAVEHVRLLQNAGAPRVLRLHAAAAEAPLEVKIFARILLRNLEQPHMESLV